MDGLLPDVGGAIIRVLQEPAHLWVQKGCFALFQQLRIFTRVTDRRIQILQANENQDLRAYADDAPLMDRLLRHSPS